MGILTTERPLATPTPEPAHAALQLYTAAVSRILETTPLDDAPELIVAAAAELVVVPDLLTQAQSAGDPETYRRHLLYADPDGRFTVLALVWEPGQFTPVHGHHAWGVVGVHQGELCSASYRHSPMPDAPLAVAPDGVVSVSAGAVCSVRPDPEGIHRLANISSHRAISIHTYGMDISDNPARINKVYAE